MNSWSDTATEEHSTSKQHFVLVGGFVPKSAGSPMKQKVNSRQNPSKVTRLMSFL
jgi:hypothetical protein